MKKNQVQFQSGMSLRVFLDRYGSEPQCREALAQVRWPGGFRCQDCGHTSHCHLKHRDVYQCNRCKRQVSLTSGTLFAKTHLPLRTWFLAIYLLTQHKNGISALAMHRQLGVSYNTAWLLKQKLMQAMVDRDSDFALGGIVQMDDAYWGGERHGGGTGRVAARARRRLWRRSNAMVRATPSPCGWIRWSGFARPCWRHGRSATWSPARRWYPMD